MTEYYSDPVNSPFWEGASNRELRVQKCGTCQHHQHYGRPFCLACSSDDVAWVQVSGIGTVYSVTTVRMQIDPSMEPPYQVALVDLEEGPRLMSGIVGAEVKIGDRVHVSWRDRENEPPLYVFQLAED